jgi:hypothetical protein
MAMKAKNYKKYVELHDLVAKITTSPDSGKQNEKTATMKMQQAVKLVKKAGFSDFIPEAGLYYDGRVFVHITHTQLDPTKPQSWRVSACVCLSEYGNDAYRAAFANTVAKWRQKHAA